MDALGEILGTRSAGTKLADATRSATMHPGSSTRDRAFGNENDLSISSLALACQREPAGFWPRQTAAGTLQCWDEAGRRHTIGDDSCWVQHTGPRVRPREPPYHLASTQILLFYKLKFMCRFLRIWKVSTRGLQTLRPHGEPLALTLLWHKAPPRHIRGYSHCTHTSLLRPEGLIH